MEIWKKRVDYSLLVGIVIFLVVAGLVFYLNQVTGTTLADFVLEMNGFMLDVVLFAVLIVWLNKRRERNSRKLNYLEQLEDFKFWKSEEGVNRKVGIIRRLNQLDGDLPSLARFELPGAYLKDFDFEKIDLSHANLSTAFLLNANLQNATLFQVNCEKAYLEQTLLKKANLREAYLGWVDLRSANLSEADLSCANLELAILWNSDLSGCILESANLDKADLTKANLKGAFCMNTVFGHANVSDVDFTAADLRGANLQHVENMTRSQLISAVLDSKTIFPLDLSMQKEEIMSLSQAKPKRESGFKSTTPSFRQRPKSGTYRVTQTL